MSDPFAVRLAELAPAVDLPASRELFESLRSDGVPGRRGPSSRRWLLAAACVLLLVAGVAGVWAVAGRDDDRAPAGPPADGTTEPTTVSVPSRGDGTEFRLIAMEPVGDFDGHGIKTAATQGELAEMLDGYRDDFARHAQEIAFESSAEVAVVIERFDNACPIEFHRFTPVGSTWRVEWAEKSSEPCEDIGLGWVYLVAVRRDALSGIDAFVLPAEQLGSTELPELTAPVPDPEEAAPATSAATTLPTDPTIADPTIAEPRVMLVAESSAELGTVLVAPSAVAYDAIWEALATQERQPAVDFQREVAVAFVVPDDACPPTFEGFDIMDDPERPVWTPRLVETTTTCRMPLVGRLFVIAVDRGWIDGGVEFLLPGDDSVGTSDTRVEVDPAYAIGKTEWGCSPTDAPVAYVTVFSPGGSTVVVELFDAGRSVDRRTSRTDGTWTTMTLVPEYAYPPSPDGEIVVTDSSTGQVVLRQPFDHTDRPDGLGCD